MRVTGYPFVKLGMIKSVGLPAKPVMLMAPLLVVKVSCACKLAGRIKSIASSKAAYVFFEIATFALHIILPNPIFSYIIADFPQSNVSYLNSDFFLPLFGAPVSSYGL